MRPSCHLGAPSEPYCERAGSVQVAIWGRRRNPTANARAASKLPFGGAVGTLLRTRGQRPSCHLGAQYPGQSSRSLTSPLHKYPAYRARAGDMQAGRWPHGPCTGGLDCILPVYYTQNTKQICTEDMYPVPGSGYVPYVPYVRTNMYQPSKEKNSW